MWSRGVPSTVLILLAIVPSPLAKLRSEPRKGRDVIGIRTHALVHVDIGRNDLEILFSLPGKSFRLVTLKLLIADHVRHWYVMQRRAGFARRQARKSPELVGVLAFRCWIRSVPGNDRTTAEATLSGKAGTAESAGPRRVQEWLAGTGTMPRRQATTSSPLPERALTIGLSAARTEACPTVHRTRVAVSCYLGSKSRPILLSLSLSIA
jgi:hypothetical protein